MKNRTQLRKWIVAGCLSVTCLTGCRSTSRFQAWRDSSEVSYFQNFVTQIEYPDVNTPLEPTVVGSPTPLAIQNPSELQTFDLTLQEAIRASLQSSEVLRTLGGAVVSAPQGQTTQLDAALTDLNPLGGTQAALAAFDAQVTSQLFWQKNNRPFNNAGNPFLANGFEQTVGNYTSAITKRTATGASYALRSSVVYDNNNTPFRAFRSDFTGFLEAEYRQPLLAGAGSTFNRIAGTSTVPGNYNGVLIARINTDISLADFEAGVLRLINDVEGAYWELYFAYRALDAQVKGRSASLEVWEKVNARSKGGVEAPTSEPTARSTFYIFSAQVNDALAGTSGLYNAEQRLRYVMGLPPTDGRLIRPSDEPLQAEVNFDWEAAMCDALTKRVEIRRQEWTIKRRELELIASRLNKRPRLDALTQYRWRGLGDHLIGSNNVLNSSGSLTQSIVDGNFQEWQAGFDYSYAVGLRQASAAVRHAQLNLARDMTVLKEQQLRISHDLSNASRQISRSYEQLQINYNRNVADQSQVEIFTKRLPIERGGQAFFTLGQVQQQAANSESAFYRALVDYNLALRDFHREKGSLLAYNQVNLSEEALDGAMQQAAYQRGRNFTPRDNPEAVSVRDRISQGPMNPSSVGLPANSEVISTGQIFDPTASP